MVPIESKATAVASASVYQLKVLFPPPLTTEATLAVGIWNPQCVELVTIGAAGKVNTATVVGVEVT